MALASDVIDRARDILADVSDEAWEDVELLRWLNDAVRELIVLKPSSVAAPLDINLVAGPQQSFPANMVALVALIGLVSDDGATHYDAVTEVMLEHMDRELPGWRTETETAETLHVMRDETDRATFWVYPPTDGTRSLRVLAASLPASAIATTASSVPFRNDQYVAPLVDYVCYRALLRDADEGPERQRALDHFEKFAATLVGHQQARRLVRQEAEAA